MIDNLNAKKLVIENENNKLEQSSFIQIHFAPSAELKLIGGVWRPGFTRLEYENVVYFIDNNGQQIFVKLDFFDRIKFKDISNQYTKICSGVNAYWWKGAFKLRYPTTNDDTDMAVYYYDKITM